MKPTIKILAISTALSAAGFLLPGAASANGCPPGTDWWNGSCVSNPATGGDTTNTATGGNGTGVGVGVGVGTGIGHGGQGGDGGQGGVGHGGAGGSATSTATGGQGGNATGGRGGSATATGGNSSVRGSGNSSSRSGVSGSGNSTNRVSNTVNANTSIKHAANSAIATNLNGYGAPNCFGDSSPSGSFVAALQTFGWGVSAGSTKASNVCAIYAVGGERAAIAYLAAMDPNAHRALVAAGLAVTPSHARQQAAQPVRQVIRCPETHPIYVEGKGCRK